MTVYMLVYIYIYQHKTIRTKFFVKTGTTCYSELIQLTFRSLCSKGSHVLLLGGKTKRIGSPFDCKGGQQRLGK